MNGLKCVRFLEHLECRMLSVEKPRRQDRGLNRVLLSDTWDANTLYNYTSWVKQLQRRMAAMGLGDMILPETSDNLDIVSQLLNLWCSLGRAMRSNTATCIYTHVEDSRLWRMMTTVVMRILTGIKIVPLQLMWMEIFVELGGLNNSELSRLVLMTNSKLREGTDSRRRFNRFMRMITEEHQDFRNILCPGLE